MVKKQKNQLDTLDQETRPTRFKANGSPTEPETPRLSRTMIGLLSLTLVVLGLVIAGSLGLWRYLSAFESTARTNPILILNNIRAGLALDPFSSHGRVTILILGIDNVTGRTEQKSLTDTIILATIERTGLVNLVSIPRDLWLEPYSAKVNAIYELGEQHEPGTGIALTKQALAQISGLPIDYYILVKLDTLQKLVDDLGGIDINVEHDFTDEFYPKDTADVSTTDPKLLYETIAFKSGWQHFDGQTTIKYLRSRQSSNPEEGTDGARNRRQQLVMAALLSKLTQSKLIAKPALTGALYSLFHNQVMSDLTDSQLVALGKYLVNKKATIKHLALPVEENTQPGLIKPVSSNRFKQWVYEPVDPSWKSIHLYLEDNL
jgi:LCP family protein required for cell wall assembly